MKNVLLLLALILVFLGSCKTQPKETDIAVMTFNIRLDTESDSTNAWSHRKENVGTMLRYYSPDILGTQEVLHNQLQDLRKMLPGYNSVGVGRADGKEAGEYCALFFNEQKFALINSATFGLNEHPEKIGEKGWDAACERIVTWCILKEIETGAQIAVFNTHFDHMGEVARRESAKLILKKIEEIAGDLPVILMGDLNGDPQSEPVQIILSSGELKDSRVISSKVYGPDFTFQDFWRLPENERELIDFIFVKDKNITVEKYRIIDDFASGYLSDHNPVEVYLTLKLDQ